MTVNAELFNHNWLTLRSKRDRKLMNRQQLFILLLLFPVSVIGQTETFLEKNFDQYTTSSGMSNNTVTGIMQDSTGYIWIATSSGLNRFNGSRFVQFHSNNDNSSLAAEDLTGLTWLDKNRLAVFTVGLHIINTANGCTR